MEGAAVTPYLSFAVGQELCAIAMGEVREIVELLPLTRLPESPPVVRGVINVRGQGVVVFDLATRLALPARPPGKQACIVILERSASASAGQVGLLVDAARQLLELRREDIAPAADADTKARREVLEGVAQSEGQPVLVLDIGRVLAGDPPPASPRRRA